MSVRRRTQSSGGSDRFVEEIERTRREFLKSIREEDRNDVRHDVRSGYSLKAVIIICVLVSIICQSFLPLCISFIQNFIQDFVNEKPPTSPRPSVGGLISNVPYDRENTQVSTAPALKKTTFLVDPIYDQKWKDVHKAVPVYTREEMELIKNDPAKLKEALAAAKAAKKSRKDGNLERAMTIIKHAMALAPDNPDILTEMGQVREEQNDFIEADQCYVRALSQDPNHSEALVLRAKTGPLVTAIDRKMLRGVHDLRDEFAQLQHLTALRKMMRETYFSYVYHTVAIEGNTLSLGETRAVLESGMAVPGKSIREHNEVIGMDAALRFLNCSLLSKNHDQISLEDILEMHRRVLGNADPVEAGRLRTTQVYVGRFTPVGPEYVLEQMQELTDWLNHENTLAMDPIERAAIAHYKLVLVHPFTDGNGRTARLLLNLIMMRSGFPPVILPVETRATYYATLHVANLGDLRPFVRYVAKYTEASIQKYIGSMKTTGNSLEKDEHSEVGGTMPEKCRSDENDGF